MVEGLSQEELRQITSGAADTEQAATTRIRRVELTASGYSVLNALEQIGYK